MEKILKIVGAKLITNEVVEVILMEYISVSLKKPSLLALASGKTTFEDLMSMAQNTNIREFKIYISFNEWIHEFKNQLFSNVKMDIKLDKTVEEIANAR